MKEDIYKLNQLLTDMKVSEAIKGNTEYYDGIIRGIQMCIKEIEEEEHD